MPTSAIVVRQTLPGTTSALPWMSSPDLLPLVNPSGDTSGMVSMYNTPLVQPPAVAHANTVYVRGKNTGTSADTARVTLYSVQHDPMAGVFSDLLNPAMWLTAGFSVGGHPSSVVSLQGPAGTVILGQASWTPPAQASATSQYVLLAWVDGGGNPPPGFATMPPFNTIADLGTYVTTTSQGALVVLDTAYGGMFARQYVDEDYAVSAVDASTDSAPDLLLYSGKPAFDPGLVQRNTGWSTHQPPTVGGPNYLYVRGTNTASQAVTATVSLFYAVNQVGASNPLLDPSTWKSDTMTVGGAAGNSVTVTGAAVGSYMSNISQPVVWQPATAAPTGASYAVIAWIDSTGGHNPPPFASMSSFPTLAAFTTWVSGTPNLLVWKGSPSGLFLRQSPGQSSTQPGTGAMTSPDIIVNGTFAAQDASAYVSSYGQGAVSATGLTGVPNFVYVRAYCADPTVSSSRVYLYWGNSGAPALNLLSNQGFTVAGKVQNWVDLTVQSPAQVAVSTVPIVWTPQAPGTGNTIYLVAYVDGSSNPQPPDFSQIGYQNLAAITQVVATQPQLSWVATTLSAPASPPTWSATYPPNPTTAAAAGRYLVGLQFSNLPVDGTLQMSVPGPDAADTVVVQSFHPPTPNGVAAWPATYPAGFPVSAQVSYWQGATTPPQGANASFVLVPYPATRDAAEGQ